MGYFHDIILTIILSQRWQARPGAGFAPGKGAKPTKKVEMKKVEKEVEMKKL